MTASPAVDVSGKYYLAIDPGMTNLAVWAGNVAPDLMPVTKHIGKFDISGGPLYASAVDLVMSTPWMSDPALVAGAVVETQAPANVPARIVAASIYGALRGRGIPAVFSGSAAKNKTMERLSKKVGFAMTEKPKRLGADSEESLRAKRRRDMHKINKENSVGIVRATAKVAGDVKTLEALARCGKKADDLADAILLGVGLCASQNSVK